MRTHRLLLYAWWIALFVGFELSTQDASIASLVESRFFPILGVLVLFHAIVLFWMLLQRAFSGVFHLSLVIWGMVVWTLAAILNLLAPLGAPDLASWSVWLLWGGHLLFALGAVLHLVEANLWWVGLVGYGWGWFVALRLALPGGTVTVPPLTLGLSMLVLYLGGSFGLSWGIWLAGLLGLVLTTMPFVAFATPLVPVMPVLGATLLLGGALREMRA